MPMNSERKRLRACFGIFGNSQRSQNQVRRENSGDLTVSPDTA